MSNVPPETLKCALCGHCFQPAEATAACGACPLHRRCTVLRCPHCGYEFVGESKFVRFVRQLLAR